MTKTKEGNGVIKPKSAIVFSASLASRLSTEYRLPPTYIGVRRVRPSSRIVQKAMLGASATTLKAESVVYKIKDPETGIERRMNAQEKKQLKLKLREERQQEKKQLKKAAKDETLIKKNDDEEVVSQIPGQDDRYVQLQVDKAILEQELADLRGERNGVPPVALAPALLQQAIRNGIFQNQICSENNNTVVLDDDLAKQWAAALKSSMSAAEKVRSQEDLRPMPYQLVPEVWNRMRPNLGDPEEEEEEAARQKDKEDTFDSCAFSLCEIRPALATSTFDSVAEAVIRLLYEGSGIHFSCGSKFGCDFLLYDGPRESRHAFAGLRILSCDEQGHLPLPTAYNLAGYVRCLNTAGKLALLATVARDESQCRVAIVDVALEKVISTTGRSKPKSLDQRYKTLAKK